MENLRPEEGGIYHSLSGTVYRYLGMARHCQTGEELLIFQEKETQILQAVTVPYFTKEFQKAGEDPEQGLLYAFLNADSNEEKLILLQQNRSEMTKAVLETVAQSLDYTLDSSDPDRMFLDLEQCLRTKIKYERRRI